MIFRFRVQILLIGLFALVGYGLIGDSGPVKAASLTQAASTQSQGDTAVTSPCPGERFTDVCPGDYFYTAVLSLNDRQIISGYDASPPCPASVGAPCFLPYSNVTRGQISKIVALADGLSGGAAVQEFQDVPLDNPFYQQIEVLASAGFMSGYACGGPGEPCIPPNKLPYFRPNNNVTRGQLSKIVSNTIGYSESHSEQGFQDVLTSDTFYIWIQRLASRNIISGYACGSPGEACGAGNLPYFRPNAPVTRGQSAKIVYNVWPGSTNRR